MIEIRRAAADEDFRQLYDLFVEYEADLPSDLRHGAIPDAASLEETYREANAAFLAARDGGAIGCVALAQRSPETALLQRLYVEPSGRGRGAARALVEACIRFARSTGHRRIVLDTSKRLTAACRLYESLGFEECEPYGGVDYDSPTFMELRL